jgi:hypothetical protein|tara:strand:- start:95 stop:265 length:171 start_codon:yes stop_codon:yes gene_type:complete
MSEDKRVFAIDSACIPAMQRASSTADTKSASIPSMSQAPGTGTTSPGSTSESSPKK